MIDNINCDNTGKKFKIKLNLANINIQFTDPNIDLACVRRFFQGRLDELAEEGLELQRDDCPVLR